MKTTYYIIGLLAILSLLAGCASEEVPPDPVFPGEDSDNVVGQAFYNEFPNWGTAPGDKFIVDPEFPAEGEQVDLFYANQEFIYKYYYIYDELEGAWSQEVFDGETIGSSNWIRNGAQDGIDTSGLEAQEYPVAAFGCDRTGSGFECNENKWLLNGFSIEGMYDAFFDTAQPYPGIYEDNFGPTYSDGKIDVGQKLFVGISFQFKTNRELSLEDGREVLSATGLACAGASGLSGFVVAPENGQPTQSGYNQFDGGVVVINYPFPDNDGYTLSYVTQLNNSYCSWDTPGMYEVCVMYNGDDTDLDLPYAVEVACTEVQVGDQTDLFFDTDAPHPGFNIGGSSVRIYETAEVQVGEKVHVGITLDARREDPLTLEYGRNQLEALELTCEGADTNSGFIVAEPNGQPIQSGFTISDGGVVVTNEPNEYVDEHGYVLSIIAQVNHSYCTWNTPGTHNICVHYNGDDIDREYTYNVVESECRTINVLEDTPIDPVFPGGQSNLRIFVTQGTYEPTQEVVGFDAACATDSANPDPSKNWKAIVATDNRQVGGSDWVLKPNRAYYQVDGTTKITTTDATAWFMEPYENPINNDRIGVRTGFEWASGQKGLNCGEWLDASVDNTNFGSSDMLNNEAFYEDTESCDFPMNVYCVEQE